MLHRLYVHNFRCLENFELIVKDLPSALLIGKNGSGKSTVASALEVLQQIGRGTNRISQLVLSKDFTRGRQEIPIRFELEVLLSGKLYKYVLALDFPENFKEPRVLEEQLVVSGDPVYSREEGKVTLYSGLQNRAVQFMVDWHLAALPLIQDQSRKDSLHLFKAWLSHIIILAPLPSLMTGDSGGESLEPKRDCSNFGEWFSGVLGRYPAAYTQIDQSVRELMPDLADIINEPVSKSSRSLVVRFREEAQTLAVSFGNLSDGEKCFFIFALVLAANQSYGPLLCYWDEPDNYISLSEVGHGATSLRRAFENCGQLLLTSHNPEAIRAFSRENTLMLSRRSHLAPTRIRPLSELSVPGDLVNALILDDVE